MSLEREIGEMSDSIRKKVVMDDHMRPVAVLIDYEDWARIEKVLGEPKPRDMDLSKHAGVIQLKEDPLEFQKRMRREWE